MSNRVDQRDSISAGPRARAREREGELFGRYNHDDDIFISPIRKPNRYCCCCFVTIAREGDSYAREGQST